MKVYVLLHEVAFELSDVISVWDAKHKKEAEKICEELNDAPNVDGEYKVVSYVLNSKTGN